MPVDGVILEGRSSLDESLVTGESMPVTRETGGKVIAGTLNQSGGFVMRAEKVGRDTLLSQIVKMVAEAQRSRAPIQRLADRVAGWFVPAVIVVALSRVRRVWSYFGPEPRMAYPRRRRQRTAHHRLPLRAWAGDADVDHGRRRARRAGRVLMERRSAGTHGKVDTLVVDRDRHAHRGKPKVVSIISAAGFEENEILLLAASVERSSEHPLADAIVWIRRTSASSNSAR